MFKDQSSGKIMMCINYGESQFNTQSHTTAHYTCIPQIK